MARGTLDQVAGATLLSDAPEYDQRWLDHLLDTVDAAGSITVRDFDHLAFSAFEGQALDRVFKSLARGRAPHRAGADAERLARAWAAGLSPRRGAPPDR